MNLKLYKKLLKTFKNSKKRKNGKKIYKIFIPPPEYQTHGCTYVLKMSIMFFDLLNSLFRRRQYYIQ